MSLGFGNNMNGGGGSSMTMMMLGLGVCCVCSSSASALAAGLGWIPMPGADPSVTDAPLIEDTGAPSPADTGAPAPPPPPAGLSNVAGHLVNARIRLTNVGRFVSRFERMNLAVATPCSDKTSYEQDDVNASREVWKLVPSADKKAYKIQSERTDSCASKYLVATKSGTVAVSDRVIDALGLWYVRSAGRDEMGNAYFIVLNRKFTDDKGKAANALAFSSSRSNPKAYLIGSTTDNKVNNQFGKWVIKRA